MATFKAILRDWVNEGFDPFAAPVETGTAFGPKQGDNIAAIERTRIATQRMPGLPGDSPLRDDMPVNRAFADVPQDEPEIHAEPGFEGELHAFSLFKYLSRSDVTWNPSVTAVCKASLACPTTEEFILPVFHGNDRVEWFIQLSDEIVWDVGDKNTGAPRARVTMKAGDVAAMPADIRHQGYSTKRSMLYVWENVTPGLPQRYESGELSPYPVDVLTAVIPTAAKRSGGTSSSQVAGMNGSLHSALGLRSDDELERPPSLPPRKSPAPRIRALLPASHQKERRHVQHRIRDRKSTSRAGTRPTRRGASRRWPRRAPPTRATAIR